MDAQQEIFTALRKKCVTLFGSEGVYDSFLPPAGTPYPFVYLENSTQTDGHVKAAMLGEVTQNISVWHDDPQQRGSISGMCFQIKREAYSIEKTQHYGWHVTDCSQQIIADESTGRRLIHAVIELTYKYSYTGGNK